MLHRQNPATSGKALRNWSPFRRQDSPIRLFFIYAFVFLVSFALPQALKAVVFPPSSHHVLFACAVFLSPAAFLGLGAWQGKSSFAIHIGVLGLAALLTFWTYPEDPLMDAVRDINQRWVPDLVSAYIAGAFLTWFYRSKWEKGPNRSHSRKPFETAAKTEPE